MFSHVKNLDLDIIPSKEYFLAFSMSKNSNFADLTIDMISSNFSCFIALSYPLVFIDLFKLMKNLFTLQGT